MGEGFFFAIDKLSQFIIPNRKPSNLPTF